MNILTKQMGVTIYDRWAEMWSGVISANEVMAPQFQLRYAQPGAEHFNAVTDIGEFATSITEFRAERPGIFYTPQGPAVVDMDSSGTGIVSRPYLATIPGSDAVDTVRVSGTDILRCERGKIVEVWSVSARGLPFYPEG